MGVECDILNVTSLHPSLNFLYPPFYSIYVFADSWDPLSSGPIRRLLRHTGHQQGDLLRVRLHPGEIQTIHGRPTEASLRTRKGPQNSTLIHFSNLGFKIVAR